MYAYALSPDQPPRDGHGDQQEVRHRDVVAHGDPERGDARDHGHADGEDRPVGQTAEGGVIAVELQAMDSVSAATPVSPPLTTV